MDALELTMKCSKLLKKPYSSSSTTANEESITNSQIFSNPLTTTNDGSFLSTSFSDNDFELSRLTPKEGLNEQFFFLLFKQNLIFS